MPSSSDQLIQAVLRFTRRRPPAAILVIGLLVGAIAALVSLSRDREVGVATAHAVITPATASDREDAVERMVQEVALDSSADRGELVAAIITSPSSVEAIAGRIGVAPNRVSASTQVTASVPGALIEPGFERRAGQLLDADAPYHLDVQARALHPIVDVYAQAPTPAAAGRLADAAIAAGDSYLLDLDEAADLRHSGTRLSALGPARTAVADGAAPLKVAGLTFLTVTIGTVIFWLILAGLRRGWRGEGDEPASEDATGGGDWPRTRRILPWMLAGFSAIVWLVPFNGIEVNASLPIDLTLDRILLPALLLVWVLALAVGGPAAPRLRFTAVHVGIGLFALAAFVSVAVNADALNAAMALDLSLKKLSLLVAFASVFLVVASVVRESEIKRFLDLNIALAVLCSAGALWEYRFGYNVFYDLADQLLPSAIAVAPTPSGFDDIGRRSVVGPTDHGLELVAMLSMALPMALVGMVGARRVRSWLLYAVAASLIGAAAISTYRKSAFLAPAAGLLVMALMLRRQVMRLAPLAAVAVAVLALTSFSAFGSIAGQFDSEERHVTTIGDRVSDYDAVRPDVLASPALGRGFGSYEHTSEPSSSRILDSDILLRAVEIGIVGLVAFVGMIVTVIVVAVGLMRRRGSPIAPIAASAATSFLVLTALFDEWSFPHAPYLFLTIAGLLAVAVAAPAAAPAREKPWAARVLKRDVRHRRTGPTAWLPGPAGAAGAHVRAARAPRP